MGDILRAAQGSRPDGGRDLTLLHEHFRKDDLVAWPGTGSRTAPAPGTPRAARRAHQGVDRYRRQCP